MEKSSAAERERFDLEVESPLQEEVSVKRQCIATGYMMLLGFSFGAFCGWPSAAILILKAEDSPLPSGPITDQEASWIASTMCLGGLAGTLFFGWVNMKVITTEISLNKHSKVDRQQRPQVGFVCIVTTANIQLAAYLLRNVAALLDCFAVFWWLCWRWNFRGRSCLRL